MYIYIYVYIYIFIQPRNNMKSPNFYHHDICIAVHPPRSLPASTARPVPPCEWRHLEQAQKWQIRMHYSMHRIKEKSEKIVIDEVQ